MNTRYYRIILIISYGSHSQMRDYWEQTIEAESITETLYYIEGIKDKAVEDLKVNRDRNGFNDTPHNIVEVIIKEVINAK